MGDREARQALTMDLMTHGWVLSDVGHKMTWLDLKAFVAHLPPDSALRRQWNPDGYLNYVLHKPENQLMAQVHDRLQEYPYIRANQVKNIPPGIISTWLSGAAEQKREAEKKHLSSSEIRARVAASMR